MGGSNLSMQSTRISTPTCTRTFTQRAAAPVLGAPGPRAARWVDKGQLSTGAWMVWSGGVCEPGEGGAPSTTMVACKGPKGETRNSRCRKGRSWLCRRHWVGFSHYLLFML